MNLDTIPCGSSASLMKCKTETNRIASGRLKSISRRVSGDADAGEPVVPGAGRRWPRRLLSKGAGGGPCKLGPAQMCELEAVLAAGPAARGVG